ncbi:MAG: hypothetical protein ABEH43_11120, partial [Flavobacteriales bacterium]
VVANTSEKSRIPEDKLFERFYRHSPKNGYSWGLGLSIANKIAQVNGWKLSYDYNDGQHKHIFTLEM